MDGWGPIEWINATGFVATTLALGLAVWQIWRTANAATATRNAIIRAEQKMSRSHLLLLLPQLHLISQDLDDIAVDVNASREFAVRTLSSAHRLAADVATLLRQRDENEDLVQSLQVVADLASEAKGLLIDDRRIMPKSATKALRPRVADAIRTLRATSLDMGLEPAGETA